MDDQFFLNGKTYQLRFRKCGKDPCKCKNGERHGPYWYASGDYGGLKYIGKSLPNDVIKVLELIETEKVKLLEIKEKAQQRGREAYAAYSQAVEEQRAIDALMTGSHADKRTLKNLGLDRYIIE